MSSEQRLAEVFVELADTLVTGFDLIDFLSTLADATVELLAVDAAGLMLTDQRGQLQVVAATTTTAQHLELAELANADGPCLDSYRTGQQVVNAADAQARWPQFTARAAQAGFASVHALPMRLRQQTIGAMNLFCVSADPLSGDDVAIGQALADVGTIGLLQERSVREKTLVAEQLQGALNSRITIEQAKGMLAERAGVDPEKAFTLIRAHARREHLRLGQVATAVIEGSLDTASLSG